MQNTKRANTMSTITVELTIKVKTKFTSSNAEKIKWIHLTTDVTQFSHKSPNKNTHKKDLPRDTADLPLCHTQKHAKINYPPRHSVKHRNRNTVHASLALKKPVHGHGPTKIASLSVLSYVLVHKATMQKTPLLVVMSQWSLYQVPPGGKTVLAFRKICRPGENHPYSRRKKQSAGPLVS